MPAEKKGALHNIHPKAKPSQAKPSRAELTHTSTYIDTSCYTDTLECVCMSVAGPAGRSVGWQRRLCGIPTYGDIYECIFRVAWGT